MTTLQADFPAAGKLLQSVRESCHALRTAAGIRIESSSIEHLLCEVSSIFRENGPRRHGLAFPLNFPNPRSELNFLSVLSLLRFGSGYNLSLYQATGRDAWDSVRAFVLSLYITSSVEGEGSLLSAKGMQSIKEATVAELMGLNIHVEKAHETLPGVKLLELGGPLYELVQLITATLNETGQVLVNAGYIDLGSFVLEALEEGEKAKRNSPEPGADVEVLLDRLVGAFPAFRDMCIVHSQPVYCLSKALFLVYALHVRFGEQSSRPFPVPACSHLPLSEDNVLPSLLIHMGVIDLSASPSLSHLFPGSRDVGPMARLQGGASATAELLERGSNFEGPVVTMEQAFILRAAATDACEMMMDVARNCPSMDRGDEGIKSITLLDLRRILLWLSENHYQDMKCFVFRPTVFF